MLGDSNYPAWLCVLKDKAFGAGSGWTDIIDQSEGDAANDPDLDSAIFFFVKAALLSPINT